MNTVWQDLRYGARMLLKNPGFSLIAVITLALGIGANTAIFSVVNAVLIRPLPYEEADRLVILSERHELVPSRWISYSNFLDWQTRNQVFEALSTTRGWMMTLTGKGEPESLNARMVGADYFTVLRAKPLMGRAFLREEDKVGASPVTILSYGFWQSHFGGDPTVIGQSLTLNNQAFTIIGVMPSQFQSQDTPPLWMLIGQLATPNWMIRDMRTAGYVVARLKPGVTLAQAQANMKAIGEQLIREHPINVGHTIRALSLYENIVGDVRPAMLLLLGAVGLVLLIACANVANLLLARASSRQKEFAIRAALGASRLRLMRQMLIESVLLAVIGGGLGLLLAWWGVDLLKVVASQSIPRLDGLKMDWRVLGFTAALSLLTGITFGLAPAWHSSKHELHGALKEGGRSGGEGGRGRLRGALVVTEIALAVVLLVGAGLFIKSLARMLNDDPGFDPRGVMTMRLSLPSLQYTNREQVNQFHEQLIARVAALPGVQAASISNELPGFVTGWQTDIAIKGRPQWKRGDDLLHVDWGIVSADYFRVMSIPVLKGRTFTPREVESGAPMVVIDEMMARRFWPNEEAVGQYIFRNNAIPQEIIGIVRSVKPYGGEPPSRGKLYTPLSDLRGVSLAIRLADADWQGLIAAVTHEIHVLDKNLPVTDAARLDQLMTRDLSPQRFNTLLLSLFAALALALAAVGIYGVMSYTVTQRTHEIGIRGALGAQRRDILRLIVGQGLALTLAGVACGVAGAFALTRLMAGLLFGVTATDPLTFVSVAALLVIVALTACWIPARRATRVDPMIALRCE